MFESVAPKPLPDHLRWRYVPIPSGGTMKAWKAGAVVGVMVHWSSARRSIPCRRLLSKGKLACNHCHKGTRWIGYVPLLTCPDRNRVVVIVPQSTFTVAHNIGDGVPVEIGRPVQTRRAAWVKACVGHDHGPRNTAAVQRHCDRDIRPYLLHLWQDRELCEFFQQEFFPALHTSDGEQLGNDTGFGSTALVASTPVFPHSPSLRSNDATAPSDAHAEPEPVGNPRYGDSHAAHPAPAPGRNGRASRKRG